MLSHASLLHTLRSGARPQSASNYSHRAFPVARAGLVGLVIGGIAPWVSVVLLMVSGLGFHGVSVATSIVAAASGGALLATTALLESSLPIRTRRR